MFLLPPEFDAMRGITPAQRYALGSYTSPLGPWDRFVTVAASAIVGAASSGVANVLVKTATSRESGAPSPNHPARVAQEDRDFHQAFYPTRAPRGARYPKRNPRYPFNYLMDRAMLHHPDLLRRARRILI